MNQTKSNDSSLFLSFLYKTVPGRMLLRVLTCPFVSKIGRIYMDSPLSRIHIKKIINNNHINLDQFEESHYRCFNDFFTRKIRPEFRPVDKTPDSLIAPCDAQLSAYQITDDLNFMIKGSYYSVADLLDGDQVAEQYKDGTCLVFRLGVGDYHRYCYIDNGTIDKKTYIKGKLHTIRPIAFRKYPVFIQNCREYSVMHTRHFGTVTEIEIGALLVGKIQNYHQQCQVRKGVEKGKFLYGGSTIVLLMEDNSINLPAELFSKTKTGVETAVKYGQKIGECTELRPEDKPV